MTQFLSQLLQFYSEEPTDPFNIYALAIEYQKTDIPKAQFYFEELLKNYPEYTATYYHAAALYLQINKPELAREVFLKGLEITEKLNKNHANGELKRAYRSFLDEEME